MEIDEDAVEEKLPTPPSIDLKIEPVETGEGEPAKFIVKVSGHPRPRVTWWVNGTIIASVSILHLTVLGCMTGVIIQQIQATVQNVYYRFVNI